MGILFLCRRRAARKEFGMKLRFKIALCVALMLFAAASLLSVLAELGVFSS